MFPPFQCEWFLDLFSISNRLTLMYGLHSAGYDVRDAGQGERLLPITETLKEHGR
jgi:hypothetical protein